MASLEEVRQKYPQYQDLSDEDLANKLHSKYYPDLSAEDFRQRIGFESSYAPIPEGQGAPEARTKFRHTKGLGRSVAHGATFGGSDEAIAAARSALGQGDYEALVSEEREALENIPLGTRIPAEIAGGLATTAVGGHVLGPAAKAIPGAARTAAAMPGWMKAAGLGGLFGGAYGFGTGEGDLGSRLEAAGRGALISSGLGAAGYPVVKGLGWAGGQLWDSLRKRFAAPMSSAMSKVWQATTRDEMSAARLGQRLAAVERGAPGQATIADIGGKNLQGLARHTASVPGQAQNRAAMLLNQRAEGEASRVSRAITKGLDPEDYYAAQDAFLKNMRERAGPLYEKAYAQYPAVSSAPLTKLLESPTGKKALKEAITITQNERAAGIAGPDIAKAVESGNIPLQVWDDIKRGFDALMQKPTYRNKLTERLNTKGFSVDMMRRSLLKELDKASGGAQGNYASARRIYAGEAEALEALRDGRKLFTMDPEAITRQIAKLSDAGKESFRSGAAMKPIADNKVIQIEITNGCVLACANCTRHVGHHRKPFMMTLDQVSNAIRSLDGFPGRVGLMGGEPAMHPKFREILALYRALLPKDRREFWTTGWKWYEFLDDIRETFHDDLIHYNDHTQTTGKHQPLLVAIEDVIPDVALREELIDDCWVQRQWSASVTPRGAFFCEVAASLDHLFDGPGGWKVEPGWWKRIPADYAEQRNFACNKCSAAIPMETLSDGRGGRDYAPDVVSSGNLERLKMAGSPKIARGHYEIFSQTLVREHLKKEGWKPSHFRDFVAHNPADVDKHTAKA